MTPRPASLLPVGVLLSILLLETGCAESQQDVERRQVFALGTLVEFSVVDPGPGTAEALRRAEDALLAAEARWRAWDEGELAGVNRSLAEQGSAVASAELAAGIVRAQELATLSGKRFNPAIGRLVEAWGFHQEERPAVAPPGMNQLRALTEPPLDPEMLQVDGNTVSSSDPRLYIDMGGFAKGLAVEAAIDSLRADGIGQAIVNAGGDLKTLGRHGERDWRIGVRHPSGEGVVAALDVPGGWSVFTSGNYERQFDWEGQRYHHILDPATGLPARGLASVTVLHRDAAVADAAATALFVAGPGSWPEVAAAMGVDRVMVIADDGSITISDRLQDMVEILVPQDASTLEIRLPSRGVGDAG